MFNSFLISLGMTSWFIINLIFVVVWCSIIADFDHLIWWKKLMIGVIGFVISFTSIFFWVIILHKL